jgi:hypothetical protein
MSTTLNVMMGGHVMPLGVDDVREYLEQFGRVMEICCGVFVLFAGEKVSASPARLYATSQVAAREFKVCTGEYGVYSYARWYNDDMTGAITDFLEVVNAHQNRQ